MQISIDEYNGSLEIFASGVIKDSSEHGCVVFHAHNKGGRYRILLFKNGQIRINENPKGLTEAVDRFNGIVNTYFENEQ